MVLQHCVERHVLPPFYADESVGLQILRGESIVLLGSLRTKELRGMTAKPVAELKQLKEAARKQQGSGEDEWRMKEDDEFALY